MRKLGFSFLSSVFAIAVVVACGGTDGSSSSSSSSPPPAPSSPAAGADGAAAQTPSVDGGTDSETPPSKPASGVVGGHAFTFAYGIATPKIVGGAQGYEIFLSNLPINCEKATIESSTSVSIGVAGQPPAAKTYTVIDVWKNSAGEGEASADFNVVDATCGSVKSVSSLSGTLVVEKFDATMVKGSFDITFQTSSRVKDGSVAGTFEAVVCPKFPAITCKPH